MKKALLSVFTLFICSNFTYSALLFDTKNQLKDPKCPTWDASRFKNVKGWFTVGVAGTQKHGYDFEIPISRHGVTAIWCALGDFHTSGNGKRCQSSIDLETKKRPFMRYRKDQALNLPGFVFENLEEQYVIYANYAYDMAFREGISHLNVGLVLEYLSRLYLQDITKRFPRPYYGITGGVSYSEVYPNGSISNTIGELDIIVYERKTCQVVAIGESKATSKKSRDYSLQKARAQLKRIKDTLSFHGILSVK